MDLTDDRFNFGSRKGLVPPGNKLLAEPMLTQIYVVTWRYNLTMCSSMQLYELLISIKKMPDTTTNMMSVIEKYMWPLLLTWFNFNPSMDK